MTERSRDAVVKAVEKGLNKRGVSNERADEVYRLLLADGPMSSSEIVEATGFSEWQVSGGNGAVPHLLADGRAYAVRGQGNKRMYYAVEEGEEVPT